MLAEGRQVDVVLEVRRCELPREGFDEALAAPSGEVGGERELRPGAGSSTPGLPITAWVTSRQRRPASPATAVGHLADLAISAPALRDIARSSRRAAIAPVMSARATRRYCRPTSMPTTKPACGFSSSRIALGPLPAGGPADLADQAGADQRGQRQRHRRLPEAGLAGDWAREIGPPLRIDSSAERSLIARNRLGVPAAKVVRPFIASSRLMGLEALLTVVETMPPRGRQVKRGLSQTGSVFDALSLAIRGGTPVPAPEPYPAWPQLDERDISAVTEVLREGQLGGFPEPGPPRRPIRGRLRVVSGRRPRDRDGQRHDHHGGGAESARHRLG